jgi:MOSC domain-containing protein YiiM
MFIGRPENHAPEGEKPWVTAIFRKPVREAVFCTRTGFEGDRVANRRVHGGPDKAVLFYAATNYATWGREVLGSEPGGFGENLCVEGLDEWSVCIGDRYRIGEAEVEVSQPRGPCETLARRWNRPDMVRLVRETHRSGWYVRILREGKIGPGDAMELTAKPNPQWTIARTAEVNYARGRTAEDLRDLLGLKELSLNWKSDFQKKLDAMVVTSKVSFRG